MNNQAGNIDLRVLRPENGFMRFEIVGRLSRDGWPVDYDPFVALYGSGVYASKVLLNLNKSNYLDSSGVSWLLICNKRFQEGGGALVLHSASPMTMQFLKMMRMDLALTIVSDEATARQKAVNGAHKVNGEHPNGEQHA